MRNSDGWEVLGWTQIEAVGQDVVLTADHQFVGAVSINAHNVIINDIDDIVLGTLNLTGSLTITGGRDITVAHGGSLVVAGTTTLQAARHISLGGNNDLNGLSILGAQNVTLNDIDNINLAGVSLSGNLSLSAAGAVTDTAATAVGGTTTVNAGSGAITLDAGLRSTGAATLSGAAITLGETAATANLGIQASGAVVLADGLVNTVSVGGNLSLSAGGAVSDVGTVRVTGTSSLSAVGHDLTLDSVGNDFTGAISLSAGSATVRDANSLSVTTATVAGALSLDAGSALTLGATSASDLSVTAGAALTDTGALVVSGTTTVALGGADATLDHASNNFGTLVVTSARHLTVNDSSALTLGTSHLSGNLALTLGGALSQAAGTGLIVAGTTVLAVGSSHDITLANMDSATPTVSRNDFVGALTITSGRDVSLSDRTALNLAASTISGNLSATSGGILSDSGNLSVAGSLSLNAGSSDIVLDNANTLGAVTSATARNLTLVDTNALALGTVTLSGNLIVNAGGDLSQTSSTAVLRVAGSTQITVASGSDVLLGNANGGAALNRLGGTVSVDSGARDVQLSSDVALDLGNITASRDMSVLANAAISDSGRLNIGGQLTLTAASAAVTPVAQNITLDGTAHLIAGTLSAAGAQLTLRENAAMALGTISATGNLSLTAAGAITGSGAVTAGGSTRIDAAGNTITLNHANNDFSGTLTVVSGGSISVTDANALSFAGSSTGSQTDLTLQSGGALQLIGSVSADRDMSLSGTTVQIGQTALGRHLLINASGALTQDAGTLLRVGGNSSLSGASIALGNAGNSLSGTVALNTTGGASGHVQLRNASALDLGVSAIGGHLTLQADGALTQSGAMSVQGNTSLVVGANNDLTLSNASNDFVGAVTVLSGKDVTLRDSNSLMLGAFNVAGDLALRSVGDIDQTTGSALNIAGESTFNSSTTGQITLANMVAGQAINRFEGGVILTQAGHVTLAAAGGVHIISANVAGSLEVDTTPSNNSSIGVHNSQVWVIGGDITIRANGQNVTLTQPHDFQGTLSIDAHNATINDVNHLVLGTVVMSGDLSISVGGNLSMAGNGSLAVDGHTQLQAGGNVTLGDVTIGRANAASNLTISAGASSGISQTSGKLLKVFGNTVLSAGSGGIVLANANGANALNDWVGTVGLSSAGVATLRDSNRLSIAQASSSGAMSLTAAGEVSLGTVSVGSAQSAADLSVTTGAALSQLAAATLTVSGQTSLSAASDITLNNRSGALVALNDFGGQLNISTARDVLLSDKNALALSAQSVRALTVAAAGALSLGPVSASADLVASGNFTLSGHLNARSVSLSSSATLDMAGYTITATGTDGQVQLQAQGNITLGRIRAVNGDVRVQSVSGSVFDGLMSTERVIATGGAVSVEAGSSAMAVRLWDTLGNGTYAADTGILDVMAGRIDDLRAASGVSVGIGSGNGGIFTGVLETDGTLTLDFGSAGIQMTAGSALRAGQNLSMVSTGDLTLAEVSAGQTVNIQTTGAITALSASDTAQAANVKGAAVLLSGSAIGSASQALRVDAQTTGNNPGVIRLVSTPSTPTAGDAYLDITTALDGSNRRTVELGSTSDDWTIGGLLKLNALTANLVLKGHITAGRIDMSAEQGSLSMSEGKTLRSDGQISLSGQSGVSLARIIGSSSDTSQEISVRSEAGLITDLSVDELANLSTAGDLLLSARGMGSSGSADIDVQARRLQSLTATTGAIFIESLASTQTTVGSVSAAGAFDLRVGTGRTELEGHLTAGLINIDSAGHLSQADNTVLSTAGSANLRSGGDIALTRLMGGNGSVSLAATGDVTDASNSTAANIVMGTGSLSIEARRIGSDSEALELDAGNVALIKANETSLTETAIHVTATRAGDTTTLAKLETVAGARWTQSTGHLALTGALSARALDLQVTTGDLRQNAGTLTVQSDLALQAGGHIALSSMTSTGGNISLQAGASILDATSNAETVLLSTAASGKTIRLQAGSGIGTDNGSGDLEISTDQLTLAQTTEGGIYLSSARSLTVGEVTAAEQASVNLSSGSLTLSDSFSGASVQVGVAAGALTMGANATVLGSSQVTLASAQDMAITRVMASGPDAQVALISGGVLRDVSGAEPGQVGGWNIEANGTVSLEALAIGEVGNDFDVRAGQITRTANSAGAWLRTDLYDASAGGTVVLSADAISGSGRLYMILMSGDLLVTQSFSANSVDLRALGGRIEMSDGVVLTAVGDMNLVSGQDMVLSRLVTNTGRITLQAGGRIIDGSSSELANITGTQSSASLQITASRVGSDQPVVDERQVIDLGGATGGRFKLSLNVDGVIRTTADIAANTGSGDTRAALDLRVAQALDALGFAGATYSVSNGEVTFGGSLQQRDLPTLLLDASALTGTTATAQIVVSQEGGVPGDINLNIASLTRLNGGALGVYLQSERSLEVGSLTITGDLDIELTSGDLLLTGSQSARDIRYSAVSGRLTMNDGVVASAAGSADLYAYRDLRLSRLVVAGTAAEARVVSELGALIDNSAGEGTGQENIVVQAGTLSQLKGQSVGSRFVGGELDVNAQQIGTVQASSGGAFVQITGAQGGQARITELVANAVGADVGVRVTQGGLRVDSAQAADQLSIQVEGDAGSTQGQLALGQLSAGGDLTLGNRLGGIAHSSVSSVLRAESPTALTRLSAGGDIDLSGSLNDFATLRIDAAANAQVRDRNDLNLGAVTVSGDLSLRAGSAMTALQGQSVTAGRHASMQLDSGTLTLAGANTVRAQTGDLSIQLASGSLSGLGSSTLAAGRDVLMQAQGQVGLGGATQVTAGRSVEVNFSGSLSTSGTTQVSAQTGRIAITSSNGQLSLSGTTGMLAATGVDISLTQGSWATAVGSTTTVRASDGALTAQLGNGSVSWRGTTSLEADSISVRANGAQASLSAQNSTTLSTDRGDLVIELERGGLTLQGSSSLSAARHLSLQIAGAGPMSLSGASTLSAGSAQLAGDLSLSVAAGDLSLSNASTLRASQDLRLNLAQGNWRTSGATTLSAGRDAELSIAQGSATLTQRSVINAAGSASLSAERGINASGLTDLLASTDLLLMAEQGGLSLSNTSTLRAGAGDIGVTLGTGDLRIADDSLWQAGRDLSVTIATGDLLALNQTQWSAQTGRLAITSSSGQLSLNGTTSMLAATGVDISLTQGSWATAAGSTTTVRASDGALTAQLGNGSVTWRGTTSLEADSISVRANGTQASLSAQDSTSLSTDRGDLLIALERGGLTLQGSSSLSAARHLSLQIAGAGPMSLSGTSTLSAGSAQLAGDLSLSVAAGGLSLSNTSTLRASAGDIGVTLGTGDLRITDDSLWQAGRDLSVTIAMGDLLALNQTSWTAGQDVQLAITTGSLQTQQSTEVSAGRDIGVALGAGSIGLNDSSLWTAGRDQRWQTRDAGAFTMSDSETALVAGRDLSLDIAQTVRIDWLQAGNTMSIRSASGAILDNTVAETDLLAARHLVLDASLGIGRNWEDNLNTYVTGTLSATNRERGGINLQNWVGLALGSQGVSNRGESNIVLISGGTIEHGEVLYQTSPGTPRSISNPQGQKIYVIHNQPPELLLEQWGNRTPNFIDIRTSVPESAQSGNTDSRNPNRPTSLIPTSSDGDGLDAANRLLQSLQASGQNLLASQPIKLAEVLRESRDGQPRNPFGANLLPEIQGLANEVGGAGLLRTQAPSPAPAEAEQAPAGEPRSELPQADAELALMHRPVLRQAMLLADDNLDLPLIDEVVPATF